MMAFEGAIEVKHEAIKPMLSETPSGARYGGVEGLLPRLHACPGTAIDL